MKMDLMNSNAKNVACAHSNGVRKLADSVDPDGIAAQKTANVVRKRNWFMVDRWKSERWRCWGEQAFRLSPQKPPTA